MIVFADSSALVKLYADEPDHKLVREQGSLVVSTLARVEVPAAIWAQPGSSAKPSFAAAARSMLSKAATVRQLGTASAAVFALALSVLIAALIPAFRASSISPMQALRTE